MLRYKLVRIVLKNARDLRPFLFLKILSDTSFLCLNILLVILGRPIHQTPLGDIWLEIPCDTAVRSHCDFYVYICSFLHITPQAAGNIPKRDLKSELNNVYGTKNLASYVNFLVHPIGIIDRQLIIDEKDNIDQIIATLALKEMSQSTLIKKLCALSPNNKTRKALFEYNKLIRSIYTLKCILDPKILENAHRSQNRLESYHTLRGAIAKVSGRKALLGRTDLEMEIANQCGLLIASAIIYSPYAKLAK